MDAELSLSCPRMAKRGRMDARMANMVQREGREEEAEERHFFRKGKESRDVRYGGPLEVPTLSSDLA